MYIDLIHSCVFDGGTVYVNVHVPASLFYLNLTGECHVFLEGNVRTVIKAHILAFSPGQTSAKVLQFSSLSVFPSPGYCLASSGPAELRCHVFVWEVPMSIATQI